MFVKTINEALKKTFVEPKFKKFTNTFLSKKFQNLGKVALLLVKPEELLVDSKITNHQGPNGITAVQQPW